MSQDMIVERTLAPITDSQIKDSWSCVEPSGQAADIKHLRNLANAIERARRINQELCCTPLRHRIDEELCTAWRTIDYQLKTLKVGE